MGCNSFELNYFPKHFGIFTKLRFQWFAKLTFNSSATCFSLLTLVQREVLVLSKIEHNKCKLIRPIPLPIKLLLSIKNKTSSCFACLDWGNSQSILSICFLCFKWPQVNSPIIIGWIHTLQLFNNWWSCTSFWREWSIHTEVSTKIIVTLYQTGDEILSLYQAQSRLIVLNALHFNVPQGLLSSLE